MGKARTPRRDSRGRFVSARSSKTRSASTGRRRGKGYRKNPIVGNLRSIIYDRPGDPGPSYEHKAGDMGLFKVKSKAKLVAGKGGALRITGQRWLPGIGIVG